MQVPIAGKKAAMLTTQTVATVMKLHTINVKIHVLTLFHYSCESGGDPAESFLCRNQFFGTKPTSERSNEAIDGVMFDLSEVVKGLIFGGSTNI